MRGLGPPASSPAWPWATHPAGKRDNRILRASGHCGWMSLSRRSAQTGPALGEDGEAPSMITVLLLLTLVLLVAYRLSLRCELGASPKVPPHQQVQLYAPSTVCSRVCNHVCVCPVCRVMRSDCGGVCGVRF